MYIDQVVVVTQIYVSLRGPFLLVRPAPRVKSSWLTIGFFVSVFINLDKLAIQWNFTTEARIVLIKKIRITIVCIHFLLQMTNSFDNCILTNLYIIV